jgi:molybdopterin-guanine dinucleotide biosynthesis protein A
MPRCATMVVMAVGVPVPVLVLAGGSSRRMGTDKRNVPIDGTPMLLRTIARCAGSTVSVVIDPRDPPNMRLPDHVHEIPDARPGEGPLAALEAGLSTMTAPVIVVIAADMPWVEPAVLRLLVARLDEHPDADVACLADEAAPRPLPIAIRRDPTLARLTPLLDEGERRLRSLLAGALVIPLADWLPFDPARATLRDVDVPADLVAVP